MSNNVLFYISLTKTYINENIICEIFRIFSGYLGEIWWISWGYMGVSWVDLVYTWKMSGENLRGIWGMLMGWFGDYVYH